jgi:hypothetical protein
MILIHPRGTRFLRQCTFRHLHYSAFAISVRDTQVLERARELKRLSNSLGIDAVADLPSE